MATAEQLNAYELLGVSPTDDAETVRKAYRRLVMSYHPDQYKGDKAAANEKLVELIAAFDILDGPTARATGEGRRAGKKPAQDAAPRQASNAKNRTEYRARETQRQRAEKMRPLSRNELRNARKAEWGFAAAVNIFNGTATPRRASVFA